jgi:DNA helicase-2/ATP-dependent DNA helicase PcrA
MDVADNILPNCPVVLPDEKDQEGLSQYEEERRLFYVGMTRAKSELSIFRFNQADLFSTFVDELVPQNPPKATSRQVQPKSTPNPADEQKIRRLCEELVPGVWVRHVRFGRGIIVAKESDIVSIRFVNGEIRRFSLDVALRQNQLNVIL